MSGFKKEWFDQIIVKPGDHIKAYSGKDTYWVEVTRVIDPDTLMARFYYTMGEYELLRVEWIPTGWFNGDIALRGRWEIDLRYTVEPPKLVWSNDALPPKAPPFDPEADRLFWPDL